MPRPVSKPADMYNYRVAAYLKSNNAFRILDCLTKDLDYSVLPAPIPKENTYLNIELLFDIVISNAKVEFLAECKSHQIPRPINVDSIAVKEAMVEFIAAEKYRTNHYKRDSIYYLLITNCPTNQLIKDVADLKVANDDDVRVYCEKLESAATKKWAIRNPIQIQTTWLRIVLNRLQILPVEEGTLSQVENTDTFKQELRNILQEVIVRSPELIPQQYRLETTIRFECKQIEKPIIIGKRGFAVEISESILKKVLEIQEIKNRENIPYSSSTLLNQCRIIHAPEIKIENAVELVIESTNDFLRQSKANYVITLDPGTYELYLANNDSLYRIIKKNIDNKGFYKMVDISKEVPLLLSQFSLFNLVSECLRLKGTIARKDLMNWKDFENSLG